MNLLLSLILCIAMAVSGTADLGPQPRHTTEWIISNVVLSDGNETVVLEKEAVLRGAVSDETAQLQMHILNGDMIMMPMAAQVRADEMRVSFGSGTRAYSFSNDLFLELGELTGEEDLMMIEYGSTFMLDLGRVLARLRDADFQADLESWFEAYNAEVYGMPIATEVKIDGEIYPAEKYNCTYSEISTMQTLDHMRGSGIAEIDALLESLLDVTCVMEGVDPEKGVDGLMERYQVDETPETTVELIAMEQDDLAYSYVTNTTADEENAIARKNTIEAIFRPEFRQVRIALSEAWDKDITGIDMEWTINGPEAAPTSFTGHGTIRQFLDYSRDVKFGQEGETYISTEETTVLVDMKGECVDGLWIISLDLQMQIVYENGSEDDRKRETEEYKLRFSSAEKPADEGSSLCSYSLEMPFGADMFQLSFDVASKQLPYADPFEGMETYAVDLSEDSPGTMMMAADALALSGSAMLLNAQDDVFAAINLLEGLNYYGEYFEVESIEQAKTYFEAPIPAYDPPSGFALDLIEVADDYSCVDCYYWSDVQQESILVSYYDFRGQAKYHGLDEEALERGPIVRTEGEDGIVYTVDIFTPDVNVYIITDGIRQEEMDDLLRGLDIGSVYADEDVRAAWEEATELKL